MSAPNSDNPHHPNTAPQPEDVSPANNAPRTETPAPAAPPVKARSPVPTLVAVCLGLVAILLILFAWKLPPFSGAGERTDNAYIRGRVTIVSPQVSGYVAEVRVKDFDNVEAGQALFRVDDRIYRQRLDQAKATLAARQADLDNATQTGASRRATLGARVAEVGSAEAQLVRAQADMARVSELALDGSVSLRERDQSLAGLRAAEATVRQAAAGRDVAEQDVVAVGVNREALVAAVEGARAAVRLAEIDLSNTVITVTENGQLGQVGARLGQYVTAGSQLVSLVPPSYWVIANFKERQTSRMAVGQKVHVSVDALGDRHLAGRIEQISPATGSEFAVLPAQNATGNFTKIAQRLPVRIALDPGQQGLERIRPGMSVVAYVDTPGER
uniref:Secretion protein HlyD family protein n=1 Tax=Caulobacter sp. (strain K31) TaxID=366602 RepID=B0T9Y5_CAUSK